MIMVNYADLWLVHSHVASLVDGAKLEFGELKARSTLLGACTSCPLLRSDLEVSTVEIKDLKHKLYHSSYYSVLSPPCELCGSLKGKLFHATKENTELNQEVTSLTARLEKTKLSEKMVENDLSQVEESATKSTYKLGVRFERCEKKGEKSAPKFVPSSNCHKEEEALKSTKTHYPSNRKPSFNSKREVRKETPKPREETFIFMFFSRAGHLDEFCFRHKRIEKRRFDYARNSYRVLPHFSHGSQENSFVPRRFGYGPCHHPGDSFPRRPNFSTGGSHTHPEPRHLDDPWFLHCGSCLTRTTSEVQRIVKTSSSHMVKCWIPKIYLTNPSIEPSTSSRPM
jgi:hypothetical protein